MMRSTQRLLEAWEKVRASWNDIQAHDFEKQYLQDLRETMASVDTALARFLEVSNKKK